MTTIPDPASAPTHVPAHTLPTYTPAVFDHLLSLCRSYEAQRDIALHRLEECEAEGDADGVKISQLDAALAMRGLLHVNDHLFRAQQELVNGNAAGSAERTVSP